ncbi:pseudaminic acid synthase [Paenibacillus graminis]|uniref:N-acetylneuraminate synthase n=1 Tax=Paenibacillus graminis TaxID=189425 RepID=A0A089NC07_9BACL|nr:pseudaminic acid synthase [Paenibacillus graminis]AIQ66439.1 N-acetylneuraminate synthase [Paenibacillus graminis]MEC0167753.1 pseudaminic acid synthase [Paenibacillus graminis]
MKEITIGNRRIGNGNPPFIIAEMSGNHNQSLDRALGIVKAAAKAGAHAFKIQTYTPETMTLNIQDGDFMIESNGLWKGKSLFELYKEAYTPWEWHQPIFDYCKKLGMIPFSTPFDETSLEFLETLDVACYKIASFENNDIPLLKKVASKRKPMIISTGMASLGEIENLVKTIKDAGCDDFILLKCTSSYPASPENTNLNTIPYLRDVFHCQVGLSDHTLGVGAAVASVALGSTVIEKHFTLNRDEGGVDSAFSLEPEEFAALVRETDTAWKALGGVSIGPTKEEEHSLQFRRSIYISRDVKAGEVLTMENISVIRPGFGLDPKYYDLLLGKQIKRDLKIGTPLSWEQLL